MIQTCEQPDLRTSGFPDSRHASASGFQRLHFGFPVARVASSRQGHVSGFRFLGAGVSSNRVWLGCCGGASSVPSGVPIRLGKLNRLRLCSRDSARRCCPFAPVRWAACGLLDANRAWGFYVSFEIHSGLVQNPAR